ncbi:MAG: hypothetical protein ACFFAO_02125 [Candidatus Hermodarchaeota archaeon]
MSLKNKIKDNLESIYVFGVFIVFIIGVIISIPIIMIPVILMLTPIAIFMLIIYIHLKPPKEPKRNDK